MKYLKLLFDSIFLLKIIRAENTTTEQKLTEESAFRTLEAIDSPGTEYDSYSQTFITNWGKPDLLMNQKDLLETNLQIAFSTEVEYLIYDFEYVSKLLDNLYRGEEFQIEKYETGFPFIMRTFEDTFIEKIIKFISLPENEETHILELLIETLYEKLFNVQQAYSSKMNGTPVGPPTENVIQAQKYVFSVLSDRLETLEINLLQFLHRRNSNPNFVLHNKERLVNEMHSIQSLFEGLNKPTTSQSGKLRLRILAVSHFLEWVISIDSNTRPLLRADGVLAERIDMNLQAILNCLEVLKENEDSQIIKLLNSRTQVLASEFRLYGFSSDPFIEEIVRKFNKINTILDPQQENVNLATLINDIAVRTMFHNFRKAYELLMDWSSKDLQPVTFRENVEALNEQMKIWVIDLQNWNLPPTREVAELHELGHKVADDLLSFRLSGQRN